jgi:hypothetical protein
MVLIPRAKLVPLKTNERLGFGGGRHFSVLAMSMVAGGG